jgi:hypothetical protein
VNQTLALTRALQPDPPDDVEGLVELAGGNAALARILQGLPGKGRLPGAGSAARKSYETEIRNLRHYTAAGDKRRKLPRGRLAQMRAKIAPQVTGLFITRLQRLGARARIDADVALAGYTDELDIRSRELPSGGPGLPLSAAEVKSFTTLWLAGKRAEAADLFVEQFGAEYGVEVELIDVDYIKLWAEGDEEP